MSNSEKVWQLAPQVKGTQNKNYHWVVSQILNNYGFKTAQEIADFLDLDYDKLTHDPFKFNNMQKAVDMVIKHIVARNKIMIYGDYDADGVTASAVLTETLATLKGEVDVYIPDRVTEGYGLNKEAIRTIIKQGFRLIITVDGGVRSKEEAAFARSEGVDVIITDHHLPPEDEKDLPDCLIINPAVHGEKYPFKKLAGVGVAFKLAKAVISKTKLKEEDKKILEHRILDLVAIGTITDCVILRGENRVLTQKGLELINSKQQRIGLQELLLVAGFQKDPRNKVDAGNIAFQIGPRINAAGRIERATTAFELLVTRGPSEAKTIAHRLNERNIERQEQTQIIMDEVEAQIANSQKDNIIIGVCPADSEWNEGVVGLVAGKVSEKYHKPALIIAKTKDGYKGSGRSIPEYNVVSAMEKAAKYLERFGGHPAACGFSLSFDNIDDFKRTVIEHANANIHDEDLAPKIKIDVEVELDEVDLELVEQIEKLSPFGMGNPRPITVSRNLIIADIAYMGLDSQHIKLRVTNGRSGVICAIGFGQAKQWDFLKMGDRVDIVYYAEINGFNGRRDVQMRIIDIKKS
ncbi:single-stranded-DNA-specific exonuclease RecJ [Patescibacteria group bacterium]|nr:single-stranded-DNA-specific exonuclease RecJ [Patescibacteria group bacterium]